MFTQRNNKAKCFQDCIVEKKEKLNKNHERLEVSGRGWGVFWIKGLNGGGRKPQTFHLLAPPPRYTEAGSETDACKIWF